MLPELRSYQKDEEWLQDKLLKKPDKYKEEDFPFSDKKFKLITRDGKIVIPKELQPKAIDWYHEHSLHILARLVWSSPWDNITVSKA